MSLVEAVKKNPQDASAWEQLGNVTLEIPDWDMAFSAYLTCLCLAPTNAQYVQKFTAVRERYLQAKMPEDNNVKIQSFKLPHHIAVIVVLGVLNTEVNKLQRAVSKLLQQGFTKIIVDCSGLPLITGLAPSCLRNLNELLVKNGGQMILVQKNMHIDEVLQLKQIAIPAQDDIPQAVVEMLA